MDNMEQILDTPELRALLQACLEAELWPAEPGYSDAVINKGEWKIVKALVEWKKSLNG
jgi:hypothetical protein